MNQIASSASSPPCELSKESAPEGQAERAKAIRLISALTVALVGLLALGSFVLSFEALSQFAATSEAISPGRAWVFPLVVDGAIVVFSISALRCSIAGEGQTWPMSLVIVSTTASMLFNVAHAKGGVLSGCTSAMPPLLLFLSFESLMRQIRFSLGAEATAPRKPKRPAQKATAKAVPKATPRLVPVPVASPPKNDERRQKALALLGQGRSRRAVAKELGMAMATVRKIANLEAA